MKRKQIIRRLMLAAVVFILTAGSRTVLAADLSGTKNASSLTNNGEFTLKSNTVINMDVDKTIKSITGTGYSLTITGSKTLTVTGTSGSAIDVKSLSVSGAGLTISSSSGSVKGIQAAGAIKCSNARLNLTLQGGDALCSSTNSGSIELINSTVNINSRANYAIRSANSSVTITGGTTVVKNTGDFGILANTVLTIDSTQKVEAEGTITGLYSNGRTTITDSTVTAKGTTGAAIRSVNSDVLFTNAQVTAVNGITVRSCLNIENTTLNSTTTTRDAIGIEEGGKATTFTNSTVTLKSDQKMGIRSNNSTGSSITIDGGVMKIASFGHGIASKQDITIKGGTVEVISQNERGIYTERSCNVSGGDVHVIGKTYGIAAEGKISLTGGVTYAKAVGTETDNAAIVSLADTISYSGLKMFIRVPAMGKTIKYKTNGRVIADKDEKIALEAEVAEGTMLKEIHLEFGVLLEDEKLGRPLSITTVPAGALKEKKLLETISDDNAFWKESPDGVTYLTASGTTFVKDTYYGTIVPSVIHLALLMDMVFTKEGSDGTYFNSSVIQGLNDDMLWYINGKKYTVDDLNKNSCLPVGKAVATLKKGEISAIPDQEYTKSPLTPEPVVKYGGETLKKGTDYELSYEKNIEVGTAKVTIKGIGNYGAVIEKTFKIVHTKCTSDGGRVTRDATVSQKGEKTYKCIYCGKVLKTEEIPVLKADAPMSPDAAPTVEAAEKEILNITTNKDPASAKFNLLQAKAKKITNTSVTLGWTKVKGAQSYIIYGNKCKKGNKYLKLTTAKGSAKSKKITKIDGKKLKKGTYYKFIIAAVAKDSDGNDKVIAVSKSVHFITTGNKKYGDFTKVRLKSPKKLTLKKGRKYKIRATQVKPSGKKVQEHRKLSYESTNVTIAKVDKKGKITAKKKGKATIYIYAQNGVFATITVTVK